MKPIQIAGAIAFERPHLGAMILRGAYVQPLALAITAQFSTTTINTDIQGSMITTPGSTASILSGEFVVCGMSYTVQRPNWMPGSVLREQSEQNNALRPFVNVNVQFNGPRGIALSYAINISDMPMECLIPQYEGGWMAPWVLDRGQAPTVSYRNRRTLQDAEIPYIVSWALLGRSVNAPEELYRECVKMPVEEARQLCLSGIDNIAKAMGG